MTKHTIHSAVASNIGNIREKNEDSFFLDGITLDPSVKGTVIASNKSTNGLFAVCDGMGGEVSGEVASMIAVSTLGKFYQKAREGKVSFTSMIDSYTEEANARICDEMLKNGGQRMGTTYVMLLIEDNTAYIYNIGDSRAYLLRDRKLTQLSHDHTQIRQLLKMNILTPEEAKTHPERNRLTQHLGIFPEEMIIEPYVVAPIAIMSGDTFLLCSDGLTDMLTDNEIEGIMNKLTDPKEMTEKLAEESLLQGGKDNVTVLVAKAMATNGISKLYEKLFRNSQLKTTGE